MRQTPHQANSTAVRVWDLPTRVFHWLLAGSFTAAWLTYGQDRNLDIHVFAGYLFAGLLGFRLLWGFVGTHYAQFRSFSFAFTTLRAYLAGLPGGQARRYLGHNPAGSWAIFLMLALGIAISVSGLLVFGVEERHGPFAGWLPFSFADALHLGHELLAWAMLITVGGHIAGVLVESRLHRENLVAAMITGRKKGHVGDRNVTGRGLIGILLLTTAATAAAGYFRGYLQETAGQPYRPYQGPKLADNAAWREVCGECHLAYHPSLLPARSWQRMLASQADHFGDDLALDAETTAALETFLTAHAAEQQATEAAWKIGRSIPADEAPLRITTTAYWQDKHRDITAHQWDNPGVGGKSDCAACHLDATDGTFEDAAMRLPAPSSLPEQSP